MTKSRIVSSGLLTVTLMMIVAAPGAGAGTPPVPAPPPPVKEPAKAKEPAPQKSRAELEAEQKAADAAKLAAELQAAADKASGFAKTALQARADAAKKVAAAAAAQAKAIGVKAAADKAAADKKAAEEKLAAEAKAAADKLAAEKKAAADKAAADAKAAADKLAAEKKAAEELAAKTVYERCPAFVWRYIFPVGNFYGHVTKGLSMKSSSAVVDGSLRCRYTDMFTDSPSGYSHVRTFTMNHYLIKKKQPKGPGFYDPYFTLAQDKVTILYNKEGQSMPDFRCDSELKYKYDPKDGDDQYLNSTSPFVGKWIPLKAEGSVKRTQLFEDSVQGPYQVGCSYAIPPDADFEVKAAIEGSPYASCEAVETLPNFLHLPGFKCIKK